MALLSVDFLRRIDRLRIQSRGVFRGKLKGERRSTNKGTGVEFADYRVYEVGNDLRNVDWNVYARLDRLFIKLFRAEEDLPVTILLDNSKSMDFGEPTKLSRAKQIAAALGFIGLTGFDRVSFHAFSERAHPIFPAAYGAAQFTKISKAIEAVDVGKSTDLAGCLKYLITHSRRAGAVIIISDFLDMNGYISGLKQLLARKFDLTLVQILADAEINPQLMGEWRLEDSETGDAKEITIDEGTHAHYKRRLDTFCNGLRQFCVNRGANYVRITNQTAVEQVVLEDLQQIGFVQR
ncbi:MAG: DUF58 domain-containing protein [Candidatus Poribacteria bacterium]|nr:DUF58 domain-containing protein [Candidatus Poribacteria bacterium]